MEYKGINNGVEDIFTPTPKTIYTALSERTGFYIPSYQRQYDWDKDAQSNIGKLFKSVKAGMFSEDLSALVFFGAVVLVNDNSGNNVEPKDPITMPSHISIVVDGQQRLTTFTLIAAQLYGLLSKTYDAIYKQYRELMQKNSVKILYLEQLRSIYKTAADRLRSLKFSMHQICLFNSVGSPRNAATYDLYPRIIRYHEDCWSTDEEKAKYTSAVSDYLFRHLDNAKYEGILTSGLKVMKKCIDGILRSDEFDIASADENSHFRHYLLAKNFNQLDLQLLEESRDNHTKLKQALRLMFLAEFVLHRCAFTMITVNKESYEYEIFQALNTTGEPLNAIQTFKPSVTRYLGSDSFNQSQEYRYFEDIERMMNTKSKSADKALDLTLLSMSWIFAGNAIVSNLKSQRQCLINAYEKIDVDDSQRRLDFVKTLHAYLSFCHRCETWRAEREVE
ncbi:MAG: DUF262 domain-containing protein [Francisellaceae bacterium]